VELLRHSLRWNVAVAWPDNVLDIQTVPGIPGSDLRNNTSTCTYICMYEHVKC
jgi:hypothetical protein